MFTPFCRKSCMILSEADNLHDMLWEQNHPQIEIPLNISLSWKNCVALLLSSTTDCINNSRPYIAGIIQPIKCMVTENNVWHMIFKVVLHGSPRSPNIHDMSECHHLYDFGRHHLPPTSLTVLTLTSKKYPWDLWRTTSKYCIWRLISKRCVWHVIPFIQLVG